MLFEVNRQPTSAELRRFGLTMLIGLGVIGALLWWWRGWVAAAVVLWVLGAALALLSVGPIRLGTKVYVGWMLVAAGIGRVMLPVFLTLVFVLLLPVFSLIRFADPLRLRLKAEDTYWEPHKPHESTIERPCVRDYTFLFTALRQPKYILGIPCPDEWFESFHFVWKRCWRTAHLGPCFKHSLSSDCGLRLSQIVSLHDRLAEIIGEFHGRVVGVVGELVGDGSFPGGR